MDKSIIKKDFLKVIILMSCFVALLLLLDFWNAKTHILDNIAQNWIK
jgi:hypothetical protein